MFTSVMTWLSQASIWVFIGFLGQALFSARFLLQWLASEKAKRSIVPVAFWYFSICGGATLFAYALWREDPVFIMGQGAGLLIYGRNHLVEVADLAEMVIRAEVVRVVAGQAAVAGQAVVADLILRGF